MTGFVWRRIASGKFKMKKGAGVAKGVTCAPFSYIPGGDTGPFFAFGARMQPPDFKSVSGAPRLCIWGSPALNAS